MTPAEYLAALEATARAGDLKAKVFLDRYARHLVELPVLPQAVIEPLKTAASA